MRLARICADDAEEMLLAERLVGEARQRRAREMETRERVVTAVSACAYLRRRGRDRRARSRRAQRRPAARRSASSLGYAADSPGPVRVRRLLRVAGAAGVRPAASASARFRTCRCSSLPPAFSPLVPDIVRGQLARGSLARHVRGLLAVPRSGRDRSLAPGPPATGQRLLRGLRCSPSQPISADRPDWALSATRCSTACPGEVLRGFAGTARVDAILIPDRVRRRRSPRSTSRSTCSPSLRSCGCSTSSPTTAASATPRRLELQRAYRGTVMLLSDVIESEDSYTAHHSRSVVELVNAVADELGVPGRRPPGARVRGHAPRRRQDRDPEGDPEQARRAHRQRVRGHEDATRSRASSCSIASAACSGGSARSCARATSAGTAPATRTASRVRRSRYAARIVFCCDAYNAMTTDRVYREAMPSRGGDRRAGVPTPGRSSTRGWSPSLGRS